jgi:hypothetical protein
VRPSGRDGTARRQWPEGGSGKLFLGEKERRGVRNTRTQLARAEKTRSSEDGVAASSARPTMAAASAFGARERQRASEWKGHGGVGSEVE